MKRIRIGLAMILLMLVTAFGFYVGSINPTNLVPQANAQTCTTPAQVTGVTIAYPYCIGTSCSFSQASCTWNASADAAQYKLTVTEVDSGNVVVSETAAATSKVFTVTGNKTYKCDVSGVNSCGTSGTAGTFSLLCEVDAAAPIPTTAPAAPTAVPTVPPTGTMTTTLMVAVGSAIVLVIGISLFVL